MLPPLLEEGKDILKDELKAELHQSVIEVGTPICQDIKEARREVVRLRSQLAGLARRNGLTIAAAGTHPFARWQDQLITPHPRYEEIIEDLQQVARANLIFGLHVHVAVPDRNSMIDLMNEVRYFLPHLLALSTSSPFWMGHDTGLKSYRTTVFRRFPRTGVPDRYESWSDVLDYCRRSANPVGRLVLRIAGHDDARLDAWSDAICSALQLANFWQDFRIDFERGRVYLPQHEAQAHGADERDLAGPSTPRPWRRAVTAAVARTEELFAAGRPLCDALGGRLRWELRATLRALLPVLPRLRLVGSPERIGHLHVGIVKHQALGLR